MRYAFDTSAIALINRVQSAAMEVPLAEYGKLNRTLLNVLWHEADIICDWGDETDHVHSIYPMLEAAWKRTLSFGATMTDAEKAAEDVCMDAEEIATEFENRLWLACVVVNALEAIEGGNRNIFNQEGILERVNAEFKTEREQIAEAIRRQLRKDATFNSVQDAGINADLC